MKSSKILAAIASLSFAVGSGAAFSAEIVVLNFDPPGVGFNDPTPVTPVGGNPGTTLGEQRQIVFVVAAQEWGARIESDQPIFLAAFFEPLFCEPGRGTLGSAGPTSVFANFPGAPMLETWYVGGLADSLAGADLAPGSVDMVARFNGDIGVNPNCLTGQSWYNGLDNNNDPSSEFDLFTVVMHEMAHGLGFLELVSEVTGDFFFGLPDSYAANVYDLTFDASWLDITSAERQMSQVNSGNLVWAGSSVTAEAPNVLGPRPSVQVRNPRNLKGSYEAQAASYGAPLRENGGLTGKMVVANDGTGVASDACEPITNKLNGKIALVDRGGCAFTVKSLNAQNAGAKGVIVVNNVPGGLPGMGGADPNVTIPSVGVSQADGEAFKAAAARNIVGKLILDGNFLAGVAEGFVRLYAPNPFEPGSSNSHFDTSATPNLLMEPFINDDLASAVYVDLTTNIFEDIGWVLQ